MNTTEMYGALHGVTGSSAIVHIDALELPEESGGRVDYRLIPLI